MNPLFRRVVTIPLALSLIVGPVTPVVADDTTSTSADPHTDIQENEHTSASGLDAWLYEPSEPTTDEFMDGLRRFDLVQVLLRDALFGDGGALTYDYGLTPLGDGLFGLLTAQGEPLDYVEHRAFPPHVFAPVESPDGFRVLSTRLTMGWILSPNDPTMGVPVAAERLRVAEQNDDGDVVESQRLRVHVVYTDAAGALGSRVDYLTPVDDEPPFGFTKEGQPICAGVPLERPR